MLSADILQICDGREFPDELPAKCCFPNFYTLEFNFYLEYASGILSIACPFSVEKAIQSLR